jgi:hypothetical protein
MSIVGSGGFVAWFYVETWKLLQDFSKKTYGKYITHTVGVLFVILGLVPIIKQMNPVLWFGGIALSLGGIVIFWIPFFNGNEG